MADLMTLQSLNGFPYNNQEPNNSMDGASNFYGTGDGWSQSLDLNLSMINESFRLDPFQQGRPPNGSSKRVQGMVDDTRHSANLKRVSRPGADLTLTTSQQYPPPSMFTPTNARASAQNVSAISPLQTRFNQEDLSATSTASFSLAPQTQISGPIQRQQYSPSRYRRDSLEASHDQPSPASSHSSSGRRKRSEFAEPGSARAIYLEKNRKAASKCRSKQKMQQEELVEHARAAERRNKQLRAEVDYLRGGMRELMEMVGQHSKCPDGRLRDYVQQKADRLATTHRGLQTGQHNLHRHRHQQQQRQQSPGSQNSEHVSRSNLGSPEMASQI